MRNQRLSLDLQTLLQKCLCVSALLLGSLTIICGERLPVKIYTSADGLGSSFINSMMRDSRGFLWFATRDGLSRFDGHEFVTYQVAAQNSPPGIEQIYQTRNGIYWIATTNGLYYFDPNKTATNGGDPSRKTLDAQFISQTRGFLFEDSRGRLWCSGNALYLIENSNGGYVLSKTGIDFPDETWSKYPIFSLSESSDGSFWMTTQLGLIRRLPNQQTIFYQFDQSGNNKINDSLVDSAGKIWIASDKAVYVFKPEPSEAFSGGKPIVVRNLAANVITSSKNQMLPTAAGQTIKLVAAKNFGAGFQHVFQSTDNHFWITAERRLLTFDGEKIETYGSEQGLTGYLGGIAEDAGGNMWFSGQNGATRLKRFGMSAYTQADNLQSELIHSIYSHDNELYVVNGDAFVSRLNGEKFDTVRLPIEPNPIFAWLSNVGFVDSTGQWWVLTNGKLYRFAAPPDFSALAKQKPLAVYTTADGLKGNLFFRIFEDSQGNLWISTRDRATENAGLTVWTRADEKFRAFSAADGLPDDKEPVSFAEDASGNLWFGFYEGGLVRYQNGHFTEIPIDLPEGFFTALHFDRRGRLWLTSTGSGVARIDFPNESMAISARYTAEDGLSSNNVRSLVEATDGDIFVGTARGVDQINSNSGRIRHFSINDGLSGDFVNAAAATDNGTLWFGTPNGLSKFKPEANRQPPPPASVWISGLIAAGENQFVPVLGSPEIAALELDSNQNNLQIDFFAIDLDPRQALRYQYKLEGTNTAWSTPTAQRTVTFANLAPGAYRFMVRAVNADDLTGEKPAIVSFTILAPVWRRWWFVAAAILLAALGVFALDRYRVKKTREVKTALDISRKSEQAARASETRYRTLAETASDAIITIDDQSRIVYVNGAVEKVFGYQPAELGGKLLTELMPADLRSGHENGFGRYLATNRKKLVWAAIELPGQHKSGRQIPLELSFGEFEHDGKRFFTGIIRDVSERKRAEAALEKAREERLAELERVRSRIARDLHDDVGSSLTQIALFSEVAKQSQTAANQEPLEFLVQTSNELVEAMSDIVWAINPNKDRFSDLTQRMRRFASEILTAAEIDLEFVAPETDVDAPLGANLRREIFLIFKEAVNNIVKHSRATAVAIEFLAQDGFLVLSVRDDGRGFVPTDNANGDYDWRTAKGGNGLPGMKRRAADLGGELNIESKTGNGTHLVLRVPLEINLEITITPD